jgi:hypothetical protein
VVGELKDFLVEVRIMLLVLRTIANIVHHLKLSAEDTTWAI